MKIILDLRKTIPENAQVYYEKSKKSKKKIPGLGKAIKDTKKKIETVSLEDVDVEIPKKVKIREKKWFEKFRWFVSSDGFLVVGGRDATTNDILIKKHLNPSDIVFHANVHGAPFFVVQNPESKEIPETTLDETAQAAASYSSAWKQGQSSCDVYWIKPDQVSNTPPTGEYLPKGAFMIYGTKNWYRNTQTKVCIGYQQGEYTIIGGPEQSIKSKSESYVYVVPGDDKAGMLAKKIKKKFTDKGLLEGSLEDIQYFIPSGRGKII